MGRAVSARTHLKPSIRMFPVRAYRHRSTAKHQARAPYTHHHNHFVTSHIVRDSNLFARALTPQPSATHRCAPHNKHQLLVHYQATVIGRSCAAHTTPRRAALCCRPSCSAVHTSGLFRAPPDAPTIHRTMSLLAECGCKCASCLTDLNRSQHTRNTRAGAQASSGLPPSRVSVPRNASAPHATSLATPQHCATQAAMSHSPLPLKAPASGWHTGAARRIRTAGACLPKLHPYHSRARLLHPTACVSHTPLDTRASSSLIA